MGLREYAVLGPRQRLTLLLGLLGSDDLAADLSQLVAPALARLGGSGDDAVDAQLVLRQVGRACRASGCLGGSCGGRLPR